MTTHPTLNVTVPIQVTRGLNAREHHFTRAKRVKAERAAVDAALCAVQPTDVYVLVLADQPSLGARVTLLRPFARTPLDSDNLSGAFKGVRDEVAAFLGVDDKSERVHWRYVQCKATMSDTPWGKKKRSHDCNIRIRIEILPAADIDPMKLAVRNLQDAASDLRAVLFDYDDYSQGDVDRVLAVTGDALSKAKSLSTFDPTELYR